MLIVGPGGIGKVTAMTGEDDWARPSVRLLLVRRVELACIALPLLAAGFVIALIAADLTVAVITGCVILAGAFGLEWFLRRRVRAWGFAERDDDLLVRRGVLVRRLSVVPYGRMQYVDVTAGPFERAFGLATVRMHTAAAASDARIPGLNTIDAARLRDSLAQLGQSHAAGL